MEDKNIDTGLKMATILNDATKVFVDSMSDSLKLAQENEMPLVLAKATVMFYVEEMRNTIKKIMGDEYVEMVDSFNKKYRSGEDKVNFLIKKIKSEPKAKEDNYNQ